MSRVDSRDGALFWNDDDLAALNNSSPPITGAPDASQYGSCDRDAITNYLHGSTAPGAGGNAPSLLALLADVRTVAGRHPDTGRLPVGAPGNGWLAAVGCCITLDQIGGIFTANPKTGPVPSFQRALHAYAAIGEDEIKALYAMRCALVHDYSTINLDQNSKTKKLDHAFALNALPAAPLIVLPRERYDRNQPHDIHSDNQTWVNIKAFGDLVEQIVVELRARHERGELQLRIDSDNLARRFGLSFLMTEAFSE